MPNRVELTRDLQTIMRALDDHLMELHGERIGVTMFVFELGKEDGSDVVYISNAVREDMIATVKVWLARQEVGLINDPPGPQGKA
jgi:hypothetical protein